MKTQTQTPETKTLSHLTETARRAHYWLSFNPEKRGEQIVSEYSSELDSDLLKIKSLGASIEQEERYKKGYEEKLKAWLYSKSNCASSVITGGSNFPVAKMEKRNRWADNHYNNFRAWREKVLNAYARYERKQKIEDAGGELEVAKDKLKNLELLQERMKRVNKAHGQYLKNEKSILNNTELTESDIKLITGFVPQYSWIKHPFAPYQLTNNNATIKNTKDRISVLEKKEEAKVEGNKEIIFEGGKVVINVEIDRIQIQHNEIPSKEVRQELKSNGFNWSPFYKVWQRKNTREAIYKTEKILNIKL